MRNHQHHILEDILGAKQLIRSVSKSEARDTLKACLKMEDAREIGTYLKESPALARA